VDFKIAEYFDFDWKFKSTTKFESLQSNPDFATYRRLHHASTTEPRTNAAMHVLCNLNSSITQKVFLHIPSVSPRPTETAKHSVRSSCVNGNETILQRQPSQPSSGWTNLQDQGRKIIALQFSKI
jgi:hypothetical protein